MKSVPENIYLKTCSTSFLVSECLTLYPEFPSWGVEGWQLQQRRVQSPQRQMANTLGKHQFVVSTHQGEEANCMLPTSTKTPDQLDPEVWWRWNWPLITSPSTNQKDIHELIKHLSTPLPHPVFKDLPWKSSRSSGIFSNSCLDSLHGALQPMLHFPSPQPAISRLASLCTGEQTQVWLGNRDSNGWRQVNRIKREVSFLQNDGSQPWVDIRITLGSF